MCMTIMCVLTVQLQLCRVVIIACDQLSWTSCDSIEGVGGVPLMGRMYVLWRQRITDQCLSILRKEILSR